MNIRLPAPPYVLQADQDRIVLKSVGTGLASVLRENGFAASLDGLEYSVDVASRHRKAELFALLREQGVAFSRGREWSPAEIFELLREQGLVTGSFTTIAWTHPGSWHLGTS